MGIEPTHSENATLDGSRVCVTGGAGFIGSRLATRLLELGAAVTVIDDLSNAEMGPIAEMLDAYGGRFRFIQASILDPAALAEAVESASVVFHLAAVSAAGVSIDEPQRVFDVNAAGTQRVCEAARRAGVARLVFAASCSAYGTRPSPQSETDAPHALSPYAASKLAGEHLVTSYAEAMGLPGVALRFFNVYGPGQPAGSAYAAVIPIFIERALRGESLELHGGGAQTRDFVHVSDVVRALLLAAGKQDAGAGPFNIGTGRAVTVRQLAERVIERVGDDSIELIDTPARAGDVPESAADVSLATRELGFTAEVAFDDGLAELIEHARRTDTLGAGA